MAFEFNYNELADDLANVLTTGANLATLAAIEDPWADQAPEVAAVAERKPKSILDDDFYNNPPQETITQWKDRCTREARAKFEPFLEIVARIRANEFRTHTELEKAFKKNNQWANKLRDLAVKQGVFKTEAEWFSHFAGRLLHDRKKKTYSV